MQTMEKTSQRTAKLQTLMQYLVVILGTLIVAYLIIENLDPIIISGHSMDPTLKDGSIAISTNAFTKEDINKGDIVVFKHNNLQMIKRIVAMPGDEIWVEDGKLYVNGEVSPYQFTNIDNAGVLNEHIFIRANEYFCIGDNHNESTDCREFGPITFDQITYKILRTLDE